MKCQISDKYLIFTQYTIPEIEWINRRLTWGEAFDKNQQTLLLFSEKFGHYTFSGLYEPLKKVCPYPLELQNNNPEKFNNDFNIVLDPKSLKGIELLDFQLTGIRKAIFFKKGIIISPTGSGKTEQMLGVLRYLLDYKMVQRCLIVVPTEGLALQFFDRALLRGFTSEDISIAKGGLKEVRRTPIIVGVINTLDNVVKGPKRGLREFIIRADAIFIDEGHHGTAQRYIHLALTTHSSYLFYYTASPFKEKSFWDDPTDCLLYGLARRVIFSVPQKHIRALGLVAEPIIFFRVIPGKESKARARYQDVYADHLVNHAERNNLIRYYASKFCRIGFSVLILVQRKEHARILMELLKPFDPITILGASTCLRFNEGVMESAPINYDNFRAEFDRGIYSIVIATQVFDEGIDLPAVGAVILAGGGKSRRQNIQRLGRGVRRKKVGQNKVYIVDFYDRTHIFLLNQAKKRIALFRELEATFPKDEFAFLQGAIDHSQEMKMLRTLK